eukprot:COSAG01_NODE_56611_length_317_cov_0.779817_1_plen_58_part_10
MGRRTVVIGVEEEEEFRQCLLVEVLATRAAVEHLQLLDRQPAQPTIRRTTRERLLGWA